MRCVVDRRVHRARTASDNAAPSWSTARGRVSRGARAARGSLPRERRRGRRTPAPRRPAAGAAWARPGFDGPHSLVPRRAVRARAARRDDRVPRRLGPRHRGHGRVRHGDRQAGRALGACTPIRRPRWTRTTRAEFGGGPRASAAQARLLYPGPTDDARQRAGWRAARSRPNRAAARGPARLSWRERHRRDDRVSALGPRLIVPGQRSDAGGSQARRRWARSAALAGRVLPGVRAGRDRTRRRPGCLYRYEDFETARYLTARSVSGAAVADVAAALAAGQQAVQPGEHSTRQHTAALVRLTDLGAATWQATARSAGPGR